AWLDERLEELPEVLSKACSAPPIELAEVFVPLRAGTSGASPAKVTGIAGPPTMSAPWPEKADA
ncbi:MAG: hypothetical protein ACK5M8_03465, partial [Shewanella algae]